MGRIDDALLALDTVDAIRIEGRVTSVVGLAVHAAMPEACLGDVCTLERRRGEPVAAEIVGFERETAVLMPYATLEGIAPGDAVLSTRAPLSVEVGPALLGRVLDGLGRPFDGKPALAGARRTIHASPPHPLGRARIASPLPTGVRAIDGLLTFGRGQRIGLFAGSGVGKSTLLGQLARQTRADVVVVALVGERGREVREFLDDALGPEGCAKSVVVCATSDAPALVRKACPLVATTIAEHFRDEGKDVLLLVDSVTRFARASREVALSAGEPPARRGYPPSVFAELPRLLERAGTSDRGTITGIYTVLVEGGDLDEPVADEVRGILDGHVVLDRALATRGRFPAIDVLASLSRTMPAVTTAAHRAAATKLRTLVGAYEAKRDLVLLGAYPKGSDRLLDSALAQLEAMERFLAQRPDESQEFESIVTSLGRFA